MPDYDSLAGYYDTEWRNLVQDIPFLVEEAKKTGEIADFPRFFGLQQIEVTV